MLSLSAGAWLEGVVSMPAYAQEFARPGSRKHIPGICQDILPFYLASCPWQCRTRGRSSGSSHLGAVISGGNRTPGGGYQVDQAEEVEVEEESQYGRKTCQQRGIGIVLQQLS